MLFNSLILLLLSNSITLRQDRSILFSRVTTTILILTAFIAYDNLFFIFLDKSISIFGGLFHYSSMISFFHIFILSISSVILLLTSFYPRKVWSNDYSSAENLFYSRFLYYGTFIVNKMGQQYKIIEYSLIILFIVTGSILFISTSDLVSIFLAIELQSYGLYLLSTIYRDSESATSGGLMYFLLGGRLFSFILFCVYKIRFILKKIFIQFILLLAQQQFIKHLWLIILYICNQIESPVETLSPNLLRSGFGSSSNGKGKRPRSVSPDFEHRSVSPDSDSDIDSDPELKLAIALSLREDKIGESSKTTESDLCTSGIEKPSSLVQENSPSSRKILSFSVEKEISLPVEKKVSPPVENTSEHLEFLSSTWKKLDSEIKEKTFYYHLMRSRWSKKNIHPDNAEGLNVKKVASFNQFKATICTKLNEKDLYENELLKHGIDPNLQYTPSTSGSSGYDSLEDESNSSNERPNKRLKKSDSYKKFSLGFITNVNSIININWMLSIFITFILGLVYLNIELGILPNFNLPFIGISLTDLIFLQLILNSIRLIYKFYKTSLNFYSLYLKKEFLILYINMLITIILVILLISNNFDIYVYYC